MNHKHIAEKTNISDSSFAETKLFKVLIEFNVYELNRLRKFVESPYFNKNATLIRLMEFINKLLRSSDFALCSKGDVWQFLTEEIPYDDVKLRKHCSDLLKLTEQFLMQEIFEANSLQKADSLLVAVYNRKLEPLYNSALNTASRLSEQYHFRPSSYYFYEYSFERNFYHLSGLELDRTKQANIEQIAGNLDKFYVAEKLRSYITMIDRQKVAAHDYELLFMDEIFEHLESGNLRDVIPINFYYQIYLAHSEPNNPKHFELLKSLIKSSLKRLPQIEAYEVMDSALNYCISRVNSGDNAYLREYMDLSLMGIKGEVLLVNGALSPWTFRNIVFAGLRLGDFAWVQDFIQEYQYQIEERYRENAVSFNTANLYLYQKRFDKVIELLQTVEYEDPTYNLNSKIMLILTYYEMNEFDSLASLLSSFELYLRRKKDIPVNRKQHYMNLVKFVRSLMRIPEADVDALRKLRSRIENTEGVVNKSWLLEKIDELL